MKTQNRTAQKANKIIEWLEEQNHINNHLFKKTVSFNEYINNDICNETIETLVGIFGDIDFINEIIISLKTIDRESVSKNTFISSFIGDNIIYLEYELTAYQSYSKHEAVAKRKLKSILSAKLIPVTEIFIKTIVRSGSTNKYIFTYNK
jgi:hypothetical protein